MTVLRSPLIEREGFEHGFGTARSAPEDYPENIHILLQVHGERIIVLSGSGKWKVEGEKKNTSEKSGIWNLPFDKAQGPPSTLLGTLSLSKGEPVEGESGMAVSGLDVEFTELPADPFRFDSGDAMVSDIPGVSMGIRTADCLPLLVVDRVKGTAAAVHCGWRSLALGLAGKAVKVMGEIMGSRKEHLLAAIGPSIGPCCYEVGEEVREAFPADLREEGLFTLRGQKLYLDLPSGVKTQLINAGMNPELVDEIVACTACSPDRFWSWRARKDEERMVSFITVRGPY